LEERAASLPAPSPSSTVPQTSSRNSTFLEDLTAADTWHEVPPLPGTSQPLTTSQIRYCISEGVRLDAGRTVVDQFSELAVQRFNSMVNDYNRRCGQFTYRPGSLEAVQREVSQRRPQLEAEGRARFSSGALPGQPSNLVVEIQKLLLQLGYDPGPADGLIGGQTRAAILRYQLDSGLPPDGMPSESLRARIVAAIEDRRN